MINRPLLIPAVVAAVCAAVGCRQDMHNAPRYNPLAATDFFGDGRSARPLIDDTFGRGHLRLDAARYTGRVNGAEVEVFPFPMTRADLYAATRTFGAVQTVTGLVDGFHTLSIEPTGTAQAASTGTLVAVDRFDVS